MNPPKIILRLILSTLALICVGISIYEIYYAINSQVYLTATLSGLTFMIAAQALKD